MGLFDKFRAQLAEVSNDLSASLGLRDKSSESSTARPTEDQSNTPPPSSNSTGPMASNMAGAPKAKLPLAIRKNIRDSWETQQSNLEKKISDLLGVPWKVDIDIPYIYTFAQDGYAKENPGDLVKSYVEGALDSLGRYIDNHGEDGKSELNKLASSHAITMDVTTKDDITYTGCDIANGMLRILFTKDYLGTNVNDNLDKLSEAVNQAGTSPDDPSLDFNARSGIKNEYEPKVGPVKAKWQKILALDNIDLDPNFEANYAAIAAYTKNGRQDNSYPQEWQKSLGRFSLEYFSAFIEVMENRGFGDDEMVQEGFKEAVEQNKVVLRIVDNLNKGHYNEPVIEDGVLCIQTTAEFWATNVGDPAYELMDLL